MLGRASQQCLGSPIHVQHVRVRRSTPASSRRLVVRAASDQVYRTISSNFEVAVLVADATGVVSDAARRHKTAPTSTAALGRLLAGTLLLGCFKKDNEQTQVSFQGDGEIGVMQAIADDKGMIRGRVGNPAANAPIRGDGKLDVGRIVGKGVVTVVRSRPDLPQPYTGIVPIHSGEVAEDLAYYLMNSEQTNSALALGVAVNTDGSVRSAGGFLIEVLPSASEKTISCLEETLRGIPTVTDMLNDGLSSGEIAGKLLDGLGDSEDATVILPKFGPCGPEELEKNMLRVLALLGEKEVKDIMETEGKLEVTCEFCNESFQFTEEQVLAELEEMGANRH
ncbi:hypothetical protein BSKO_11567 [Bryopsis sp. KO-2023]|nr:hypothetical protein BSKO_11567 [Bryopsis sp. KO-2023]